MEEKMKKGPSEAGRKTLKCPHKQGINLNMREQKGNPRLTLLVGCLAIAILAQILLVKNRGRRALTDAKEDKA